MNITIGQLKQLVTEALTQSKKLSNVDYACAYLLLHGPTQASVIRKAMYIHNKGSDAGWSKGWYTEYFRDMGNNPAGDLWVRTDPRIGFRKPAVWELTRKGMVRGLEALKRVRSGEAIADI